MAAALTYVDTSVMVALIVPEPHSAAVTRWYGRSRGELVSAICCLAEFASALGTGLPLPLAGVGVRVFARHTGLSLKSQIKLGSVCNPDARSMWAGLGG